MVPADVERRDSVPLDESKAPLVKKIAGTKVAFFRYLRSKEFQETYFERLPLLIKTQGAFLKTLPLKRILSRTYVYAMDKDESHHRNVHFIQVGVWDGAKACPNLNDL